ncbi:tRNA-dihydrouridine(20a/20b) synthase [NAD(P)+]-like isoform X1 [Neodiprion pinetum]|uniref:tRNA-dihydrouridine(20a/20b) synthase [NAD(P)+] n=2 Tax=Neodiprion lecontei TaxID=441921 RepID=A0A6J0CC95_NEOLC|nr:tRNA-dihydrouridine(20a/20b) synthase [NAD(P)+]-like isoform X1 [Neodiprion lecontei]XP_046490028.1 tRNA-dihydrouridine(20a/20b) synthase [NAD(P)+]-like isoform X1 [Neodiprion pinetum]
MMTDILELLQEPRMTKVCAPMVRYSKLQFRTLVRKYNCDLCFTPMIMADSFVQSAKARNNEFTTHKNDIPLIAQFAAKTVGDFVGAAEMVAPYVGGVDLNCGCPQRWAIKDGYGVDLLTKPQLVKDLVLQVRNRIPHPFTVSVKIRLLKEIHKTVEFCQTLEKAGLSFITVHARTPQMRNESIDLEGLKLVRDSIQLPLIANGDVKSLRDAKYMYENVQCQGVMSANGILTNPALYSGFSETPLACIQDWLDITSSIPTHFICMHHHLVFMLEKILPKKERCYFNNLQTKESVFEFIDNYYGMKPKTSIESSELIECQYNTRPGKYFKEVLSNCDNEISEDFMENIFLDI